MKIFNYAYKNKSLEPRVGIILEDKLFDIKKSLDSVNELKMFTQPRFTILKRDNLKMLDLIEHESTVLSELKLLKNYILTQLTKGDPFLLRNAIINELKIDWLPPIIDPPLLYGIGGNSPLFFRDKEYQIPSYPRGFIRPTNKYSIIGHKGTVNIPSFYKTMRTSAELGVIIGKKGKNIDPKKALDHVFGYTLVNDMCSDDLKTIAFKKDKKFNRTSDLTSFIAVASISYLSRSTDSFIGIGPYIITKDKVPDPYNLMVYNRLSGHLRERSYTQAMINGIEQTISFFSNRFELLPGMIFHMGTMGIDGYTVEEDMKLNDEDYFEIEYENIGKLIVNINDKRKISNETT